MYAVHGCKYTVMTYGYLYKGPPSLRASCQRRLASSYVTMRCSKGKKKITRHQFVESSPPQFHIPVPPGRSGGRAGPSKGGMRFTVTGKYHAANGNVLTRALPQNELNSVRHHEVRRLGGGARSWRMRPGLCC